MTRSSWPSSERIGEVEDRIRGLLAAGDHHRAVNEAVLALQASAAFARRSNGGSAGLADSYLAATVLALAVRWPEHKPGRPAAQGVPDLAGFFDEALREAMRSITQ